MALKMKHTSRARSLSETMKQRLCDDFRTLIAEGVTVKEIGKEFGMTVQRVTAIRDAKK